MHADLATTRLGGDSWLGAAPVARQVPASIGQRLLWLMNRHRGSQGGLNERLVWRIAGPLDPDAMGSALNHLIARHDALRTTFAGRGRGLVQRIHREHEVPLPAERIVSADPDRAVAEAIDAEAQAPIDPERGPLRARLWQLGGDDHVLFLSLQHLVTDHSSNSIIARDLGALYEHVAFGRTQPRPVLWQYADWSEWQRCRFEDGRLQELQAFWAEQLTGAQFVSLRDRESRSVRDGDPPAVALGERAYERRRLDGRTSAEVKALADRAGSTPFAVTLAAFYAHLHALTGQRDLAVASLFANRARPEIQDTIGFFVNMLVLRGRVEPGQRFNELLRSTATMVGLSTAHQELPYQMLSPGTVRTARDGVQARADDIVFQFIDQEPRPAAHARIAGLQLVPVEREWRRSRFALELFLAYAPDAVTPILVYDTGRFTREWASAFADGYVAQLGAVLASRGTSVVGASARKRR